MLTVREFDRLVCEGDAGTGTPRGTITRHRISVRDFEWLRANREGVVSDSSFAAPGRSSRSSSTVLLELKRTGGREELRVLNYAGLLQTPYGLKIEILPKVYDPGEGPEGARRWRRVLLRMLSTVPGLSMRRAFDDSDLGAVSGRPLEELLIVRFLQAAAALSRVGPRRDYRPTRDVSQIVRGRIDFRRQLRNLRRMDRVHVEYEELTDDTPENRLIQSAVFVAKRLAGPSRKTAALLREIGAGFAHVPPSRDIAGDLRRWRDDRSHPAYRGLRA